MHMHNRMPTSNVHALFYHVTTIGTLINWLKCKIQLFKLQNNRFIYLGRCKGTFSLTMVETGSLTKLDTKFDQHFKASESFYFELTQCVPNASGPLWLWQCLNSLSHTSFLEHLLYYTEDLAVPLSVPAVFQHGKAERAAGNHGHLYFIQLVISNLLARFWYQAWLIQRIIFWGA